MENEKTPDPNPEPKPAGKKTWTPPKLKKMDIEETAISTGQNFDLDGFS